MKVEVLYFEGCPNHAPAVRLVKELLGELRLDAELEEIEVSTPEDALAHCFIGSPSIRINGLDVEPSARGRTDFGFCCRTYNGKGVPSRELVVAALQGTEPDTNEEAQRLPAAGQGKAEVRRLQLATVGSVISAVAASACCWLPFLLLAFGASAVGVSAWFERARPLLLTAAVVLLAVAFYFSKSSKEVCVPGCLCAMPNWKLRRSNRAMLWAATLLVLAFAFFPSYARLLLAENSYSTPKGDVPSVPTVTLGINGMSCEACSMHVQESLAAVPGVRTALVSYTEKQAKVWLDPDSPPSDEALTDAVEKAGYKVTSVTR